MLPKANRLRAGEEIRAIMRTGRKFSTPLLTLHFSPGSGRFAFITSKAVGNAVTRNLIRRRSRALVSRYLKLSSGIDGVVRLHPKSAYASFSELGEAIDSVFTRSTK